MGIIFSTRREFIRDTDFYTDLEKGIVCEQCLLAKNVCSECGLCEDCTRFGYCDIPH